MKTGRLEAGSHACGLACIPAMRAFTDIDERCPLHPAGSTL